MIRHALACIGYGWPVLPLHEVAGGVCTCRSDECKAQGKHPRTAHGYKDASLEVETAEAWWARWPTANIGIPTGPASGLLVIDLDGPIGDASWHLLTAEHGPTPPTITVKTGNGFHLYFRYPDEPISNSASKIGRHIDVRGDGGYVVAPPSLHENGSRYAWIGAPRDEPLAEPPGWCLDGLRREVREDVPAVWAPSGTFSAKGYGAAALRAEVAEVGAAIPTTRNDRLYLAAAKLGELVAGGLLEAERVAGELLYASVVVAGLPEHEARKTILSGLNKGAKNPRSGPRA